MSTNMSMPIPMEPIPIGTSKYAERKKVGLRRWCGYRLFVISIMFPSRATTGACSLSSAYR
jgi:hypothetical protein